MHGTIAEQSLVEGAGFSERPRLRWGVHRRSGTVAKLDLAQGSDRVEIVSGADANVYVNRGFSRPSGLSREHASAAEAGVVERGAEWIEVDVVDREPQCTISEKDWRQSGQEPENDGRRVDEVGIDGQPMRRDKTHRVRSPPAHHRHATALVVSDEADVAISE
jgi:hypothetical protein